MFVLPSLLLLILLVLVTFAVGAVAALRRAQLAASAVREREAHAERRNA